jgi:hypothetical protein
MGTDDEVVAVDDEVTDRRRGHVEPQRLPVLAVVERHVDHALRRRVEKTLSERVFPDRVHGIVGQPVHDLLPGLSAVVRPIDMCLEIIETEAVDGRVGREVVERRGVDQRHLAPRREGRRRHVRPRLPAVRRAVDEPVVGARPDHVHVLFRGGDGVDDATARLLGHLRLAIDADRVRDVRRLAREVRADDVPVPAAIRRSEEDVARIEKDVRVRRREHDGRRAQETVLPAKRSGRDVLHVARGMAEARELAAVHDVGVEGVRRDVPVFLGPHGVPVAEADGSMVAPARNRDRAALLLPAVDPVGEAFVGGHVIQLRRRLVVPAAPRCPAVHRDRRALVGREQDHVGVLRVDEDRVVIVPARRALHRRERLAAVRGTVCRRVRRPDFVAVPGVRAHLGEVAAAAPDA